jgi:hypothetical protein
MNHLLVQFKKDWGQFRWFIICAWLLLGSGVWTVMRALEPQDDVWNRSYQTESQLTYQVFGLAYIVLLLLGLAIFTADGWHNTRAFWRTRPINRTAVGGAKYLFILLLLAVPCWVASLSIPVLFKSTPQWLQTAALQQATSGLVWLWVPFLGAAVSAKWTRMSLGAGFAAICILFIHSKFPIAQFGDYSLTSDLTARVALLEITRNSCRKLLVELILGLGLPLACLLFYRSSARGLTAWKWPAAVIAFSVLAGAFWPIDWLANQQSTSLAEQRIALDPNAPPGSQSLAISHPAQIFGMVRDVRNLPEIAFRNQTGPRFSAPGLVDHGATSYSKGVPAYESMAALMANKPEHFTRFYSRRNFAWPKDAPAARAEVQFFQPLLRVRVALMELIRERSITKEGVVFRFWSKPDEAWIQSSCISADGPWGLPGLPLDAMRLCLWHPATQTLSPDWAGYASRYNYAGATRIVETSLSIRNSTDRPPPDILNELDQYEVVLFQYAYLGWLELPMKW